MNIELHPLEKILLDSAAISFGMVRADVERILGKGQVVGGRCYHCDGELAIDYDKDDRVEFVEFLGGADGRLRPILYGISVFETDAQELIDRLREKHGGEVRDPERGHTILLPRLSVGLYRERTLADVQEMIEEMEAEGIPCEGSEDIAEETRRAARWDTIGLGAFGYYGR